MMPSHLFDLLRDPATGEPLVGCFPDHKRGGDGALTGVLKSASREFPVLGGVVVFRDDLATANVLEYARQGDYYKAVFWALVADGQSTRAVRSFMWGLKWPWFLQFNGSPCGTMKGETRTYLRFRYSSPDFPECLGVLSCLNRTASTCGYLLDVGSGFGHFYRYFLRSYPAEKVVLLDRSLEALLTVSRFIDPKSLLVCCDAEHPLPFRKHMFLDILALNTLQYFNSKEGFVSQALQALDESLGTLWLSNNCNPRIAGNHTGDLRPPSAWSDRFNSEKWRIYPDRHFAEAVTKGGIINLAVNYVPQDDSSYWRSVTLAYSNATWGSNNKFVPLNRAPKVQQLRLNSIYNSSPFKDYATRMKEIEPEDWEWQRREHSGFELPENVKNRGRIRHDREQTLRGLAESLVMVEPLCLTSMRRDWLYPFIPRVLLSLGKRVLEI